jgi:hypothetical protein
MGRGVRGLPVHWLIPTAAMILPLAHPGEIRALAAAAGQAYGFEEGLQLHRQRTASSPLFNKIVTVFATIGIKLFDRQQQTRHGESAYHSASGPRKGAAQSRPAGTDIV